MKACRTCQAAVRWLTTDAGRRMPVDAAPTERGNVIVRRGRATVLNAERAADAREQGYDLYLPHFASCLRPKDDREPSE